MKLRSGLMFAIVMTDSVESKQGKPDTQRAFRLMWARLGRKPGKKASLRMLLDVEDLPGEGWRRLGESSWRTGTGGIRSDGLKRAREAGSISAQRRFRRGDLQRMTIVIVPFASAADAKALETELRAGVIPYHPSKWKVASETIADYREGMLSLENPWAIEQRLEGTSGRALRRVASGTIDRFFIGVGSFSPDSRFTWEEICAIADLQGTKVKRVKALDQ